MEEVFDYLRCPMCGDELMYSEGTHDLCCRNNPYERMSREHSAREAVAPFSPGQTKGESGHQDAGYI